ncbi:Hypothetical protein PENO1_080360 [Penicillium occitanis (nom. inval.)]|nr:Hypothetical protein PENO1_080360 [Penicillium occitanis (nom. inval.)]PCG94366.1 hypothetical protein PENOC_083180 [Penicillium occitanis (nom. inval.)]
MPHPSDGVDKRLLEDDTDAVLRQVKTRKIEFYDGQKPPADTCKRRLANDKYTVGWICAIRTEYIAARAVLDERHEEAESVSSNDNNAYTLGTIGKHNVVVAVLPNGEYGIAAAASVARDMLSSFPNIRCGLMVGIGGGAPSRKHDIRLGDIVVSTPRGRESGVFQYDFGKTIQDQEFRRTAFLNRPPTLLLTAVSHLAAQHEEEGHYLEYTINSILEKQPRLRRKYKRPDQSSDRLYQSGVTHPPDDESGCAAICGDDPSNLIARPDRAKDEDNPAIHYGLIASANQLMKDALLRDKLAAEKDVLCFEMEAAGLMNHFPCLVIRGICDYSDTHKNDEWQGYAAMAAAAYAKDLLRQIAPQKVEAEKRISDIIPCDSEREKREAILNWFAPTDFYTQQNDLISRRQKGTGQWFLDSAEFKKWIKTEKQILFCPGIPGAGKTVLTSIVVEQLTARANSQQNTGVTYLYCAFHRQDEQNADELLAIVLKQLAQSQSPLPANMVSVYDKNKDKQQRPSFEQITSTLHQVAALYSRIFIVIDALDECSDRCRTGLLSEIFKLQAKSRANVFATSRDIPNITEKFNGCTSLRIHATQEDIMRYIDGHMSQLQPCVQHSSDLQGKIKSKISKSVGGMFLLVQLYMDSLIDKTTPNKVINALEILPKGPDALSHAYGEAIKRIRSQRDGFRRLAEDTLLWLTCTKRLLTILELRHALAVQPGNSEFDENDLEDANVITSILQSHPFYDYATHNWGHHARVASIKGDKMILDFLENDEKVSASSQAMMTSKAYIGYNKETPWKMAGMHLAAIFGLSCEIIISLLERSHGLNVRDTYGRTPLAWAAEEGHKAVVNLLLAQEGIDEDSEDNFGRTPLSLAAEKGHEAVVEALLARDSVEAHSCDIFDQTPLLWAAENGHEAVVKLLLERADIDVNFKEMYFQKTPLSAAAEKGHEAVVKLLLAREDVNVNYKDGVGRTPLSLAAEKGHAVVVKLLLAREDLNVDDKDNVGRTPLLLAAENGHEAIVKLLLTKIGIDRDSARKLYGQAPLLRVVDAAKISYGWTPVPFVVEKGYMSVSQLLIMDMNLTDQVGRTPLLWAAEMGHEVAVRVLLEKGADIESKDLGGRTPLQWAAKGNHEAVTELLLEMGAIIDSRDLFGQTPLIQVAKGGHQTVARLLLAKDADMESKDCRGHSPLSWAAKNGDVVITKLLLEKGATVESKDKTRQTPLSWAARMGHENVVMLLLEKDADMESKDLRDQTPLLHAVKNGHKTIVKLLLEKGADIMANYEDGQTSGLSCSAEA